MDYYCLPINCWRVMFSVLSVCLFIEGVLMWSISIMSWTSPYRDPQPQSSVQGPPGLVMVHHYTGTRAKTRDLLNLVHLKNSFLLVASDGQDRRFIENCSLEETLSLCWHVVAGYWNTYSGRAVGTYPTGMPSCWLLIFRSILKLTTLTCGICRNAKELHCCYMHWRVPFIEDILESCTSGLVADSHVSEEHP